MNRLILTCLFISSLPFLFGQSKYVVDTDEYGSSPANGTMTFDMAVGLVNTGTATDTIIIDFTGTYAPTAPINITNGCIILGPAASRFEIDGSNITTGSVISITGGASVHIEHLRFADLNSSASFMAIDVASKMLIERCMFENNQSSGHGSCINIAGVTTIDGCSFFNNASSGSGGAVYAGNMSEITVRNSTFYNNFSGENGGGIATYSANGTIIFNTFFNNHANSGSGGGLAAGGATEVGANIFKSNTALSNHNVHEINANNVISIGGNLANGGENTDIGTGALATPIFSTDNVNVTSFGIASVHITDGYGLKYYPIVNGLSAAIGRGSTYSSLASDGRGAPRRMSNVSFQALTPSAAWTADAGAIEYTPYTVNNTSISASDANSLAGVLNNIAGSNTPGTKFVEFAFAAGATISGAGYVVNASSYPVIIDGFTQDGSLVPGPRSHSNPLENANCNIVLDGVNYGSHGIEVNAADGTKISGLTFNRYDIGMVLDDDKVIVYGCHFGVSSTGLGNASSNLQSAGIEANSVVNIIGGTRSYHRNTFGNLVVNSTPNPALVRLNACGGTKVQNNTFGLDGNGDQIVSTQVFRGIFATSFSGTDPLVIESNVFGGVDHGVYVNLAVRTVIRSNIFGANATGNVVRAISETGVYLNSTDLARVVIGNQTNPRKGNVFVGCTNGSNQASGIFASEANNVLIANNRFGLAKNGTTVLPNNYGIRAFNSDAADIGSMTPGNPNYFAGNTIAGLSIESQSNKVHIYNAYFGLDVSGAHVPAAANTIGIQITSLSTTNEIGQEGINTYIAGSTNHGIYMDATESNVIKNTVIGIDRNGNPAGNGQHGVYMNSSNTNLIGGNSTAQACVIAHNDLHGVLISGNSDSNTVRLDSIHNNGYNGVAIEHPSTVGNIIDGCSIYENDSLGVELFANANQQISTPTIIGASMCSGSANLVVSFSNAASSPYDIEFFRIPPGMQDPSGFGEGNQPLTKITTASIPPGTFVDTFNVAGLNPGDYVSVLITRPGWGTSQFSNAMSVAAEPSIVLDGYDTVSCNGLSDGGVLITVSGGSLPFNFEWTYGASSIAFTEDLIGVSSDSYDLVFSDAAGCFKTQNYTVPEPAVVVVGSFVVTSPSCTGFSDGSIDLTGGGMPSGGTPPYMYSSDSGSTTQASPIFSGLPAGNYDDMVVVDANGCMQGYPAIAIVDAPIITVDAGNDTTICGNALADLYGTVANAGGNWSGGLGIFSPAGSINATYAPTAAEVSAGSVTLTLASTGPCPVVTDDKIVTIITPPNAGLDSSISACQDTGAVTLTDLIGGVFDAGGAWINNSGVGTVVGDVWNGDGSVGVFNFDYVVSLAGCADDTSVVSITTIVLDDASFLFDDFCLGQPNGPYSVQTTPGTYALVSSPGGSINASTGEISGSVSGTYEVVYTTADVCPNSDTVFVIAQDTPSVDLAGTILNDPLCNGGSDGSINITATGTADLYSIDGGVSTQGAAVFTGLTANIYDLYVMNSTTGCASSVFQVGLSDPPAVTYAYASSNISCTGFDDGVIDVNTITGTSPFLVSMDSGSNWNTVVGTDYLFQNLMAGSYNVMVQDDNGCLSSAQLVVLSEPLPIDYVISVTDVCLPDSGMIDIAPVTGGTGPFTYSVNGGGSFQATGNFTGLLPGLYNLSVMDANGCSRDSNATVGINLPPTPDIVDNNPFCSGNGELTVVGSDSVFWLHNAVLYGKIDTFALPISVSDGDKIYALNQSSLGCFSIPDSIAISIPINDLMIETPDVVCQNTSLNLIATGTGTFLWTQDGTLESTTGATVDATPSTDRYYYVQLNNAGCIYNDSVFVDVDESASCNLNPSNAFSPNGDGINDVWVVHSVESSANNNISIFNRWGDLIHSFENYDNVDVVWDGSDRNGNMLEAGTYYYVIQLHDTDQDFTGWVQITK